MSLEHKKVEDAVISAIAYFNFFDYPVTLKELHTFTTYKISESALKRTCISLTDKKKIQVFSYKNREWYTIPGHSILPRRRMLRETITKGKIEKIAMYLKCIAIFPQIQLIGLSGSCSMNNAQKKDDIDLFIISKAGQMWTARFIAILFAEIFRIRRRKGQTNVRDRVCLNMFFDETDMKVPLLKRNLFTAHEVVQMRPLFMRDGVYSRFLYENRWVTKYFPNIRIPRVKSAIVSRPTFSLLELILKVLQLKIMSKAITSEIVTQTQLWFFPHDFENKMKGRFIEK